jgi:hypothetical protein
VGESGAENYRPYPAVHCLVNRICPQGLIIQCKYIPNVTWDILNYLLLAEYSVPYL